MKKCISSRPPKTMENHQLTTASGNRSLGSAVIVFKSEFHNMNEFKIVSKYACCIYFCDVKCTNLGNKALFFHRGLITGHHFLSKFSLTSFLIRNLKFITYQVESREQLMNLNPTPFIVFYGNIL